MMLEPQYINSESVRTHTVGIDDIDLRATLANNDMPRMQQRSMKLEI